MLQILVITFLTSLASTRHSVPPQTVFSVFCQLSSGFWPYRLSPGLAISALVCLDFSFRLPSSAISFSWRHLYLSFVHVRTISTSSLWGIPPSGTCVPLSRCLHFSHDLVSSFLLPTAACTFQLCAISSPPSF